MYQKLKIGPENLHTLLLAKHIFILKVCILTCQHFYNNINVLKKFLISLMVRTY